jgi:hypothetical protein
LEFLADQSCDFAVVRALRADGHDVIAVAEVARGAPDEIAVLNLASALGVVDGPASGFVTARTCSRASR